MSEELKPCPCGKSNIHLGGVEVEGQFYYIVRCRACGRAVLSEASLIDAITKWDEGLNRIAELEAKLADATKDTNRLDFLIALSGEEGDSEWWQVSLGWNNYQDFAYVRNTSGEIIGEADGSDDEKIGLEFSGGEDEENDAKYYNRLYRLAIDRSACGEGGAK